MQLVINKLNKYLPIFSELVLFIFIFILFKIASNYVAYPDEFVNLLGGLSINKGAIPYTHFFDHHLPLAWYFGGFLLNFSFGSFILFRFLWMSFVYISLLLLGMWIKKNYKEMYIYYLIFFIFYPLLGLYFWFHLYLADSLAILFFSILFWILFIQTISGKIQYTIILIASFLTFCLVFSSMTFLYLSLALYAWQLYLVMKYKKNVIFYIFISALPYLSYLLYIFFTGSFQSFIFSNFYYNTKLYIDIPNYTQGRFFNPMKFALTLIYNFYGNYLPLLTKIKHFDLYLPIGTLAGLGSLTLFILLLYKYKVPAILYFFALSFSAPRSTISNYKETDYQGSLFLMLGLISALYVLYLFKKYMIKNTIYNDLKRLIQIIIVIFMFFSFLFLIKNAYDKYYLMYTQKLPHIYDLSGPADFFNSMLDKNDYYWIGPYEPQDEFFVTNPKLPGKYPTLLPQFKNDEFLKADFINQFKTNPPTLIVYKHEASIFMTPSLEFGDFFIDYLKKSYTSIENISDIEVLKSPTNFTLRTDLYIFNDKIPIILEKLREQGYIN